MKERKKRTYKKWIDVGDNRYFYLRLVLKSMGVVGRGKNGRARATQAGIVDHLGITSSNYEEVRISDQPEGSIPYISVQSVCTAAFKYKNPVALEIQRMTLERVPYGEIQNYITNKLEEDEVSSES